MAEALQHRQATFVARVQTAGTRGHQLAGQQATSQKAYAELTFHPDHSVGAGHCHGAASGGPLEAPTLTGQYPAYVAAQLKAYAGASRRNDIYGRMRKVAAKLTDQEIADLAAYYDAAQ